MNVIKIGFFEMFHKFPDVDFPMATDTFVERIREHQLPGFHFIHKWDGEKIVGLEI